MKAVMRARPRFELSFTASEINVLMACSTLHYDFVCKKASLEGGFIYGWNNWLIHGAPHENNLVSTTAGWDEIDICMKILEMPRESERDAARKLSNELSYLLREASRLLGHIKHEVKTSWRSTNNVPTSKLLTRSSILTRVRGVWRHFVHSERGYIHDVTDGMFKLYLKGREHKVNSLKPIDMILYCPVCGLQHVDEPERSLGPGNSERIDWTNPPHRSHLCHGCGFVWRPADVPTNGVKAITTRGKADSSLQTSIAIKALEEINNWLVCACIASPDDMAQSFPAMQQVAQDAIDRSHHHYG